MITALVVDDERGIRTVLVKLLGEMGIDAIEAENGAVAKGSIETESPDLVLLDLKMPEKDGMTLLREFNGCLPSTVVVLTAHGTVQDAVEAMKLGAFDFLQKPFDPEELKAVVQKAVAQLNATTANARPTPAGIIGESQEMKKLLADIQKVSKTDATVLLVGETGTGKELCARAIHETSGRKKGPFVALNCAALPESLVESELFGHEKGAFTGAATARPGKFEIASGGTLFLDEIAELPPPAQAKLLRAVQERKIMRLGSVSERDVDIRLVVATHRDLKQEVSQGRFREDLYYRITAVTLTLPPLRLRKSDISILARAFLTDQSKRLKKNMTWTAEALDSLTRYDWPGNIRELQNVVESTAIFSETNPIQPEDVQLPKEATAGGSADTGLAGKKEQAEIQAIKESLDLEHGNVTRTAARLGLSRRGLQLKLRRFGIR